MTASPEGKETASGSGRPGSRSKRQRPSGGRPEYGRSNAWDRAFDQETEQAKEAKKRGKTVDWGKVSGR